MVLLPGQMRAKPKDLQERIGPDMAKEAYRNGLSLSAFLEYENPSHEYNDGLDAFERQLMTAGIRTVSDDARGVAADTMDAFDANIATKTLAYEWATRVYKAATTGKSVSTRSLFAAGDSVDNGAVEPNAFASQVREQQAQAAIQLSELVSMTTGINASTYQSVYIDDQPDSQHMVRIAQGSEIPRVKLTEKENVIRLHKYGRAIEWTREVQRRQRIDKVGLIVRKIAMQAEKDKVLKAVDVLINGDGNAGTAAITYALSTLSPDTPPGTVDLEAWMAFLMTFESPYTLTSLLAQTPIARALLTMSSGTANWPLFMLAAQTGLGTFTRMNAGLDTPPRLGWLGSLPAGKVVAWDRRWALERVIEVGGSISEMENFVARQTLLMTLTEVEGYGTIDPYAVHVLDLNG